ncbi:MAG: hypothetical protein J7L15_03790 [Clostridiales bacterium]|nr:hypothetical protein [Clostridiales bacterium]
MKIKSNNNIEVTYNFQINERAHNLLCHTVYIKQSEIPECLLIKEWEKQKITQPSSITSVPLGIRWRINLKNFQLTFKEEKIAELMFDLFLTDFEGKDIKKIIPEAFL